MRTKLSITRGVFLVWMSLFLSGCWSDTPVCKKLEQELRRIQLGQEAGRMFEIAKAFVSGEETSIKELKLSPEVERRLRQLHEEIAENKCIAWVPLGVRS